MNEYEYLYSAHLSKKVTMRHSLNEQIHLQQPPTTFKSNVIYIIAEYIISSRRPMIKNRKLTDRISQYVVMECTF